MYQIGKTEFKIRFFLETLNFNNLFKQFKTYPKNQFQGNATIHKI